MKEDERQRHVRRTRVSATFGGRSEIQRETIAKNMGL
jgi:alkylation response protein AidB-like acyl-CoA dehydrogenase